MVNVYKNLFSNGMISEMKTGEYSNLFFNFLVNYMLSLGELFC